MTQATKVWACSPLEDEFNLERDKKILDEHKITYTNSNSANIIIINKKYYWTIYGKWKVIGKVQWYGSKGIKDFLKRFYNP